MPSLDELEPNEAWFKEGLRFKCTQCGHCCTGTPGFVWVDEDDFQQIAEQLGEPVERVANLYARRVRNGHTLREKANGDCVFYDRTAGCTIYPVRPDQCRTWPFWESNVKTEEAWQRTCKVCPGSGQGKLISSEEIVRRMRVIKL